MSFENQNTRSWTLSQLIYEHLEMILAIDMLAVLGLPVLEIWLLSRLGRGGPRRVKAVKCRHRKR